MRPLLILLLLAACGPSLSAPASADIRDTQFHVEGAVARIWISFDNQPTDVALTQTTRGVRLDVGGVDAQPHQIEPRDRDLITSLEIVPMTEGAQLNIAASGYWTDARVELRQGGVLLHVVLDQQVTGRQAETSDAANRMALARLSGEPVAFASSPTPHTVPDPSHFTSEPDPGPDHAATPVHHPEPVSAGRADEVTSNAAAAETSYPVEVVASTPIIDTEAEPVAPPPEPELPCLAEAASVEEDPWDDAGLIAHATCLRDAGEIEDAANIYQQMLAFEPENFDIAMELATIRRTQGNDGAARALFDQAASNATSDAEAVRARARIREIQNQ